MTHHFSPASRLSAAGPGVGYKIAADLREQYACFFDNLEQIDNGFLVKNPDYITVDELFAILVYVVLGRDRIDNLVSRVPQEYQRDFRIIVDKAWEDISQEISRSERRSTAGSNLQLVLDPVVAPHYDARNLLLTVWYKQDAVRPAITDTDPAEPWVLQVEGESDEEATFFYDAPSVDAVMEFNGSTWRGVNEEMLSVSIPASETEEQRPIDDLLQSPTKF